MDLMRMLKAAHSGAAGKRNENMITPWGEKLDAQNVLPEHPRPRFSRPTYAVLHREWDFEIVRGCVEPGLMGDAARQAVLNASQPESWNLHILVPFSPEAPLSGVQQQVMPGDIAWYRRYFETPENSGHIELHFEAVDYACAVWLNGQAAGSHVGGYLPFDIDITPLVAEGTNELVVAVYDPSESAPILRGKQSLQPEGIWYTATSGIWQPVWIDWTHKQEHITALELTPNAEGTAVCVQATVTKNINKQLSENQAAPLHLKLITRIKENLREDSRVLSQTESAIIIQSGTDTKAVCNLEGFSAEKWSPEHPVLYRIEAELVSENGDMLFDTVNSYVAFRTVSVKPDTHGCMRFMLNGEPLFLRGTLDQGYWPESIMTAPSDEALVYDIEAMQKCGFNFVRKHIKIERERWYYHCDRLGMLVMQDMVSGGGHYSLLYTSRIPTLIYKAQRLINDTSRFHQTKYGAISAEYQEEWRTSCRDTIQHLGSHPSIISWCLFNEGWGQFNAAQAVAMVRDLDPTRPLDATSGWYDQGCGDFVSEHNYFRDLTVPRTKSKDNRAKLISEFGGLTCPVSGHTMFEGSYGYGNTKSIEDWRTTVQNTLAHMDTLESQGLSGYVYTQLSDIEEEINGILTYDRRVHKLF
ncbi:MAG: glycoside hydrolase family 2 [Coriobacteriales bacterium]|nr:glycoside hydrolase family 2 [Coriobacteriales bacterium]